MSIANSGQGQYAKLQLVTVSSHFARRTTITLVLRLLLSVLTRVLTLPLVVLVPLVMTATAGLELAATLGLEPVRLVLVVLTALPVVPLLQFARLEHADYVLPMLFLAWNPYERRWYWGLYHSPAMMVMMSFVPPLLLAAATGQWNSQCAGCTSDQDCYRWPGTVCYTATIGTVAAGTCAVPECSQNDDCTSAVTPHCSNPGAYNSDCIVCQADTDCYQWPGTVCHLTNGNCVVPVCRQDDDCSATTPHCTDPGKYNAECTGCVAENDC